MKFRFRYKLETDGCYSARCLDFFICTASGATLDELKMNASVALHADLTVPPHTCIYLTPARAEKCDVATTFSVSIRPGAAFALSLRELRTQRILLQRQVADRLGMQISAYQRLEDPQRANPTLATMVRIQKVFPKFDVANLFEPNE